MSLTGLGGRAKTDCAFQPGMVTSMASRGNMSATLLLAPAAQGKTEHALHRLAAARADSPGLPPIVVLLPSHTQVEAFRARLAARGQTLGVRLFTFYDLY